MSFTLPNLPYETKELEPYISGTSSDDLLTSVRHREDEVGFEDGVCL